MIYLGSDHRGYELKNKVKGWLVEFGVEYEDCGPEKLDPDDDFPVYAEKVARHVAARDAQPAGGQGSRGIIMCGSGIGIAVAANKIDGVRAGTPSTPEQARAAVHDENLNVLALASDILTDTAARAIVEAFVRTEYKPKERYERRLEEIKKIEENN